MFIKPGRKNRQYSYTPQFYKPEKEHGNERRPIRFRRTHVYRKTGRSLIGIIAALIFITYMLHLLSQIGK